MRTLTYDAGMLKAVLNVRNKTVLKNRFFKTDFLFNDPKGEVYTGRHLFFRLRDLMDPAMLGYAPHQ